MTWGFIQYHVIFLVFYYFICRPCWTERRGFFLMLAVLFIMELLWQNFMLLNIVWFIPGCLLLTSIWGFLTFMPLWIVDRNLRQRKKQALFFSLWIAVALVMGILTLASRL